MAGKQASPSRLSEIGLARESVYGTNPGTITRGMLVENFSAIPTKPVERVPEMNQSRVHRMGSVGGHHWVLSFRLFCGPMSATAATVAEIFHMIFGQDVVTGSADPYTHTMRPKNVKNLPSYTIHKKVHNPSDAEIYTEYSGFRIATVSLVIDKAGVIAAIDVTGIAVVKAAGSVRVLVFSTDKVFSPVNAEFKIGATTIKRYTSITVDFDCLTEAFDPISGSAEAEEAVPKGLNVSMSLEGASQPAQSPAMEALFLAGTINNAGNSSDITLTIDDGTANDQIKILVPSWMIDEDDSDNPTGEDIIPETVSLFAINEGDSNKDPYLIYTGPVATDYDVI